MGEQRSNGRRYRHEGSTCGRDRHTRHTPGARPRRRRLRGARPQPDPGQTREARPATRRPGAPPGRGGKPRALGAEPVIADIMDQKALLNAVDGLEADAVVHQATALKKIPMRHRDMAATNAPREAGTTNMLAAARVIGARRFVTQSFLTGYGYGDWGDKVLTEDDPFAPPGRGKFEQHLAALRSTERQTLTADGIEGIALRYGSLYGPGGATEPMIGMLRRRRLPVPRGGGGVTSLIYIDDAATATVAALERGRSGEAYNVVDDEPVTWGRFFGALAKAFGAPPPRAGPRRLLPPLPSA